MSGLFRALNKLSNLLILLFHDFLKVGIARFQSVYFLIAISRSRRLLRTLLHNFRLLLEIITLSARFIFSFFAENTISTTRLRVGSKVILIQTSQIKYCHIFFKNYTAGYLPLYFAFRQMLQSLWKIPVSSVLASQKVFSASFSSFWQTSQMSKMYPDFDSYIIRIKKFSSPKIKIWFPPSLKLRTGKRADVFLRVLLRF